MNGLELSPSFLDTWNLFGQIIAGIVFLAGLVTLLAYYGKLAAIKEFKEKYDFINKKEIDALWRSIILFTIALGCILNSLDSESSLLWFAVRIFVTVMVGLIIGVITSNLLKFYYPFYVEKRLKKLRYTPRISPKSGKPMKLLSEEEEDVYLDEGMQAEENVFSVDYDVWIDEETGYTQIEKYSGHLHALECPNCSYQTLKVMREEVLESPTEDQEGELMKYYNCSYCGHKERRTFGIAKIQVDFGKKLESSSEGTAQAAT